MSGGRNVRGICTKSSTWPGVKGTAEEEKKDINMAGTETETETETETITATGSDAVVAVVIVVAVEAEAEAPREIDEVSRNSCTVLLSHRNIL